MFTETATMCGGSATVLAASLAVYRFKLVRGMGDVDRFRAIAVPAYAVFALINLGMSVFTGFTVTEVEIGGFGAKLDLVLSLFANFIGALTLNSNFDFVDSKVRRGLDSAWAWTGAYGLEFSIFWI